MHIKRYFLLCLAIISIPLLGQGCFRGSNQAGSGSGASDPQIAVADFVAEVSDLTGSVSLMRSGEKVDVIPGTRLQTGDVLSTGDDGEVSMEFYKGSRAALDRNSEITITEVSIGEGNWKRQVVRLHLSAGRIWNRALQLLDAASAYEVEANNVIATVRGTAFLMWATPVSVSLHEFDGTVGVRGDLEGSVSEGFSMFYDVGFLPDDFYSLLEPTPDEIRNDHFVHRQLREDAEFAKEAGAIRESLGVQEDVSTVGNEAGVYTLDQPGVEHSNFYTVIIEAVDGAILPDGTITIAQGGTQALKAYAIFLDPTGERRVDITNEANWQLMNPDLGSLSSGGEFIATNDALGSATIVARWNDGTHEHSGTLHLNIGAIEIIGL